MGLRCTSAAGGVDRPRSSPEACTPGPERVLRQFGDERYLATTSTTKILCGGGAGFRSENGFPTVSYSSFQSPATGTGNCPFASALTGTGLSKVSSSRLSQNWNRDAIIWSQVTSCPV